MDVAQFSAFRDEFVKLSKTRYEKAIEAGELTRGDVTPGVPNLGIYRKTTRDMLHAPAEVAPEQLERTRAINAKKHVLNTQWAGETVPGAIGTLQPAPGMIAGTNTLPLGMEDGKFRGARVHAPMESGPFMRALGSGDKQVLHNAAKAQGESAWERPFAHLLPAQSPVDATMNHAAGQHEIGEAEHFISGEGILPNATHAGVRPIVRENIATLGDPEAVEHMSKARKMHPDDAMVQKYIRQAGGTPDAPIPVGGKQERAVEHMLKRDPKKISQGGRVRGLTFRDQGMHVPYVPHNIDTLEDFGEKVTKITKGGLRNAPGAIRDAAKSLKDRVKFML